MTKLFDSSISFLICHTKISGDAFSLDIIFPLNLYMSFANALVCFAIDSKTPKFEGTVAAVMAAYHSKSPVSIEYLSSCNAWGNAADIAFMCVGDINC